MHRYTAIIGEKAGGEALAKSLRRAWPLLPEHAVREALRKRDVLVNGTRAGTGTRVKAGDEVVLYTRHGMQEIPIVYEDEHYLIVNKPAGVNSDPNAYGGFSLIMWAESHARGHYMPELCHRLDNQASGLCLLAKNEADGKTARQAFKGRDLIKIYECLVRGTPGRQEGTLRAWLIKDARRSRVWVTDTPAPEAREILTGYRILEAGEVTRLDVRLYTGRTHQIRAHLAHIGHPILGDDAYGDRAFNRAQGQPGLKLSAVSLAFPEASGIESLRGRRFVVPAPF